MTVERMKRPWNVVGAGFNDDGIFFTFDDTTIHRGDVRLMEAAPDLLEALQAAMDYIDAIPKDVVLPAMPGFDRDWVDGVISKSLGEE